jgi:hypothetical protein
VVVHHCNPSTQEGQEFEALEREGEREKERGRIRAAHAICVTYIEPFPSYPQMGMRGRESKSSTVSHFLLGNSIQRGTAAASRKACAWRCVPQVALRPWERARLPQPPS